ncbi:carbohydrate kinase family protein [Actinomadura nitritigenes]|uniref:carbohydrate kinase family protein n=1 Tax=Actinomadura nitritigenes TaxID=134602 RepID=UPI003D91A195
MIVFCGYANVDLTVAVPVLPGPAARVQATAVRRGEGGMGANAAVAAARMGADARFAGVVGPDAASTAFLDALAADGVGTEWTSRTGVLTTAVVLLTPDGERSIISQDDQVTTEHVAAVAAQARADGADWLYLDGYRFPAAAGVLGDGPPGVVVDLDGCDGAAAARAALAAADHAVVGRAQAAVFLGDDDALASTATEHRVNLVVTDGSRGWTLFTPDGGRHAGAAIEVTAVDATGAGDCFAGSYCAELDRGAGPLEAARVAAVAAGLSCTRPGARAGLPHREDVLAYIDSAGAHPAEASTAQAHTAPTDTVRPGTGPDASPALARRHGEET